MELGMDLSVLLQLHLRQRQLQHDTRNIQILGFGGSCIRYFMVYVKDPETDMNQMLIDAYPSN